VDLFAALIESMKPAWQRDALCPEYPPEWWFPGRGEPTEPARAVCSRCLVATECGRYAEAQGVDLHGIWAGTSNRQRRTQHRSAA
jgi:WhiB family redox-sensing transcriptional regulator